MFTAAIPVTGGGRFVGWSRPRFAADTARPVFGSAVAVIGCSPQHVEATAWSGGLGSCAHLPFRAGRKKASVLGPSPVGHFAAMAARCGRRLYQALWLRSPESLVDGEGSVRPRLPPPSGSEAARGRRPSSPAAAPSSDRVGQGNVRRAGEGHIVINANVEGGCG